MGSDKRDRFSRLQIRQGGTGNIQASQTQDKHDDKGKYIRISVSAPEDLVDDVKTLAKLKDLNFSAMVVQMMKNGISEDEKIRISEFRKIRG